MGVKPYEFLQQVWATWDALAVVAAPPTLQAWATTWDALLVAAETLSVHWFSRYLYGQAVRIVLYCCRSLILSLLLSMGPVLPDAGPLLFSSEVVAEQVLVA